MDEQELSERAEQVRAYLVSLRGGAPFLSGADGRLLVGWLEDGVPVPTILSALDRVHARRLKRRARTRLSLGAVKREVTKAAGGMSDAPVPAAAAPSADAEALAAARAIYAEALAALDVGPSLRAAQAALVAGVAGAPVTDADAAATAAIAACRAFHDACWVALGPDEQARLRAAARHDLAALADSLAESVLSDLVEEAARGGLRARFPLASAREAWSRFGGAA